MSLEAYTTRMFAGHQTFHPRFGWIHKGFYESSKNHEIFSEPDATVQLGVGKNMVAAIRFWCTALRVITRQPHLPHSRRSIFVPTNVGESLLGEQGLDPYIEDISTLWILHWLGVTSVSDLPVWWATFNDFSAIEFEERDLELFCLEEVRATTWSKPSESSVRKDVDCLLRMYSRKQARGRQTLDDLLDSPFRELGLVSPSPSQKGSFRFSHGRKPNLPAAVVLYTCLDFLSHQKSEVRTISVHRLASDPGSPGRLLKLGEQAILETLEESIPLVSGLGVASSAGSAQLVLDDLADETPASLAMRVLVAYHESRGRPVGNPPRGAVAGPAARERFTRAPVVDGSPA